MHTSNSVRFRLKNYLFLFSINTVTSKSISVVSPIPKLKNKTKYKNIKYKNKINIKYNKYKISLYMRSLGTEFFLPDINIYRVFHNKLAIFGERIQHLKTIKKVDINICRILYCLRYIASFVFYHFVSNYFHVRDAQDDFPPFQCIRRNVFFSSSLSKVSFNLMAKYTFQHFR